MGTKIVRSSSSFNLKELSSPNFPITMFSKVISFPSTLLWPQIFQSVIGQACSQCLLSSLSPIQSSNILFELDTLFKVLGLSERSPSFRTSVNTILTMLSHWLLTTREPIDYELSFSYHNFSGSENIPIPWFLFSRWRASWLVQVTEGITV